jgi:hypothetical protein
MVATGEAAFPTTGQAAAGSRGTGRPGAPVAAHAGGSDVLRWAVALAGLVVVAIGMVAALHGISTL